MQWIAHRGVSAIAPENTLAAFRQAIALGADGIEFDVQRSQEGALVVFHDATLERTTDGQGPLREQTLTELKRLDAGSWFDPQFASERIPTLVEVLECCQAHNLRLYPEIKATQDWTRAQVQELAVLFDSKMWRDRTTFCAFDAVFLDQLHQLAPALEVAYCVSSLEQYQKVWPKVQDDGSGKVVLSIADDLIAVHPHWLTAAQAKHIPVLVWTVNEPVRQQQLQRLGVAGIITDEVSAHSLAP
ncbi:MAG: glycerophosphodiester phosphodiesterase family protein [Cyanobacteria bacterium P01_G01_bin.54]